MSFEHRAVKISAFYEGDKLLFLKAKNLWLSFFTALSFVVKFYQEHTNSKLRLAIPVFFSFGHTF